MTGREVAIVISGKHEDWPGGAKALTPRDPTREPNGTFWFGAEVVPDSRQVWFRITEDAIARIPAETPTARGQHLVDALLLRMKVDNRPLRCGINRFEVRVSETGEAWVERLRW